MCIGFLLVEQWRLELRVLRGGLVLECVRRHDLHSGSYGGTVHNPVQALCEIVAALPNPDTLVKQDRLAALEHF